MNIRNLFMVLLIGMLMASCSTQSQENKDNMEQKPVAGVDGNKYVPYDQRTGDEAVVYFTRNLSAEGLIMAYEQVNKTRPTPTTRATATRPSCTARPWR